MPTHGAIRASLGLVLVVASLTASAAAPAAERAARLVLVDAPKQPITIAVAPIGNAGLAGQLALRVRNDSTAAGSLQVRFLTKDGEYASVAEGLSGSLPRDRPELIMDSTPIALDAGQTVPLRLTFALDEDAAAHALDGELVVSLESSQKVQVAPISLRTRGDVAGRAQDEPVASSGVRDFVLWPLLVLLGGALLGRFATMGWERRRQHGLVVKRAEDAYATYDLVVRMRPAGRPPPPVPDPSGRLDAIVSGTRDTASSVAAYEAELRRWLRLAHAADFLEEHRVSWEAAALEADVNMVLAWLRIEPGDEARAEQLTEQAERLSRIVGRFIPVWQLWEAGGRPDGLSPALCYAFRAFERDDSSRDVMTRLESRRDELLDGQSPESAAPRWKPFDRLSPPAAGRRVRVLDWTVSAAFALVAVLVFLVTLYDADFGSPADYALAFAAGFVGQLAGAAILWKLVPLFRSYSGPTAAASSPAAG